MAVFRPVPSPATMAQSPSSYPVSAQPDGLERASMISTKSPASVFRCAAGSHSARRCFHVPPVPTTNRLPSVKRTES